MPVDRDFGNTIQEDHLRRTLGTIAVVVTAMSLIGVAWASDDVQFDGDVQGETAGSSSITTTDDSTPVTTNAEDSPSTSIDLGGSTDTSIADRTPDTADGDDDSTTSTTLDDHDSTTSTTLDDDDTSGAGATDSGVHTYAVAGVGEVTIEVMSSGLRIVAVDAPGWIVDFEKAESDKVEIEFRRGEEKAEFEAELHSGGRLSIEIDQD